MYRTAVACGLLALLAVRAPAADKPLPEDVKAAIQDAVIGVVDRASPSVVCILVSRSEAYKQLGAAPPASGVPGQLGAFDGPRLRKEAQDRHDRTREALVNRLDLANPRHVPESFGSGVVIDEAGLILTHYHVVRDATKVYVRLPGNREEREGSYADVCAADPRSDLAVLKLLTPKAGLKRLEIGHGEEVRRGQFVLALTNTFVAGFRDTEPEVDYGIVTALLTRQEPPDKPNQFIDVREMPLYQFSGTLIKTNAKVNAGCSGGALLNLKGELVGLTTALGEVAGSDAPAGFAVPMSLPVRRIIDRLKAGQEVEYGFLGVTFPPVPQGEGVKIGGITPGSPADQARIPPNQYLVRVDGKPIRTNDDLYVAIGAALAGSPIKLELAPTPNGPTRLYNVTLAKYYVPGPFIASQRPPAAGGLRVDYTSTLIRTNDATQRRIPAGVVVREVVSGSPADKANIQVDRIITQINGQAVAAPAEYYKVVRDSTGPLELTFDNRETIRLDRR